MFENSYALSCDVTAGLNPNFKDAHDPLNVSLLGNGVAVEKYGGGGGKYSTNDAPSEYMSWYVKLLDKNKVIWQTGELGRIDLGGGGTIAMYLAKYGMDVIDVGVPILAMHSPMELISKADLYSSYLAYKTFLEN
jgi:aspartyl aminopeptidase